MFYAKHFTGLSRLSRFISSHFGAINSRLKCAPQPKVQKTLKSSILQVSMSFHVIQSHRCWSHSKARH